jgi:hypothetical protein
MTNFFAEGQFFRGPWMCGAPPERIRRIQSRTSRGTPGRPALPHRTFQVQATLWDAKR